MSEHLKMVTNKFGFEKNAVYIFVNHLPGADINYVEAVKVTDIVKEENNNYFLRGDIIFSNPMCNPRQGVEYYFSDFHIDSNQKYNKHAVFEYSRWSYNQLTKMTANEYGEFFDKNFRYYPRFDDIKEKAEFAPIITDVYDQTVATYHWSDLIQMNFDERYDAIVEVVWEIGMARIKFEEFCVNPEDESDEFMEFQHEVLGDIAGEVLNKIEADILEKVLAYYNDRSFDPSWAKKLAAGLQRTRA